MSDATGLPGLVAMLSMFMCGPSLLSAQVHGDFRKIGARDINAGFFGYPNKFTAAQEAAYSLYIDQTVRAKCATSRHVAVTAYLQELAENLAARSDYDGAVVVFLSPNLETWISGAIGGRLYVDENLVRTVESEAELAGALAHEIGHLAARHAAENLTRHALLSVNPSILSLLYRPAIRAACDQPQEGIGGFWRSISYSNEFEADELATQYLWNSGIDPSGLAHLLKRLDRESDTPRKELLHWSLSHPPLATRFKRIMNAVGRLPLLREERITSSAFSAAQRLLHPDRTLRSEDP